MKRFAAVMAALLLSGCYGSLGVESDRATQAFNRVAALERRVDALQAELDARQHQLDQLGIDVHDDREVALKLMDRIEALRRDLASERDGSP